MAQFTPKHHQSSSSRSGNDDDVSPKPLSTAIMQELANLKEKFKNDDEEDVKGKIRLKIPSVFKFNITVGRNSICTPRQGSRPARV